MRVHTKNRAEKLFHSDNDGISWNEINFPSESEPEFNSIEITPNGRLFVSEYKTGIIWSDDKGKTWNHTNTRKLENYTIKSFNDTLIVASASRFLSFSSDAGQTWHDILEMLSLNIYLREFDFDLDGNLYFGTMNNGVYKFTDFQTIVNSTPVKQVKLLTTEVEAYPNPFKDIVSFTINKKVNYALIFSIDGQFIDHIKNTGINNNISSFKWNANTVKNGVYIASFYNSSHTRLCQSKIVKK